MLVPAHHATTQVVFSGTRSEEKSTGRAIRDKSATTQIVFSAQKLRKVRRVEKVTRGRVCNHPNRFQREKIEEDFAGRRAPTYACELATTHSDFGKKEFEENIATQLKSDVL
jgi:hypothetical protein